MPPVSLPERRTLEEGLIYIAAAVFVDDVYTPRSDGALAAVGFLFGPGRGIRIEDPLTFAVHTAGGDVGDENVPIRLGTWIVTVSALLDVSGNTYATPAAGSAVHGDARWRLLQHGIVEFLIASAPGEYVCRGVGIFTGELEGDLESGGPMIRNVRIMRRFGAAFGSIEWADLDTGTFPA